MAINYNSLYDWSGFGGGIGGRQSVAAQAAQLVQPATLGAQTQPAIIKTNDLQPKPQSTVSPQSTGNVSGGGGDTELQMLAKMNRNPTQESEYQKLLRESQPFQQTVPQQPQIDFDALIAPAIQGLEAAIAPLQQGFADTQKTVEEQKATQAATNKANITGQENVLNQAKTGQQGLAENAVNEARRQYAEIQQGLQSRYGGTTGTGAFAAELAGRQTQQNIGKIRQGLSSAMLEIDNKLQQVQEVGRITLQDLEDKASENIRNAKNQLDLQLADIRRQKGEIQANKAALAANAIQLYQNTVNNINAQNASFKQNFFLQQTQAEQNLKLAQQQAAQIARSFQGYGYNPGIQNAPVKTNNTQPVGTSVTGGGTLDALRKRYDFLTGGGGAF